VTAPAAVPLHVPILAGSCVRADVTESRPPGALALTWIDVADDAENRSVDEQGERILGELLSAPGFLGFVGTTIGRRGHTISVWDSRTAAESGIAHSPTHRRARRAFRRGSLGDGGFTSLWTPYRMNAQYVRCSECSTLVTLQPPWTAVQCTCGAIVRPAPFL
jgi:hypothetical protein